MTIQGDRPPLHLLRTAYLLCHCSLISLHLWREKIHSELCASLVKSPNPICGLAGTFGGWKARAPDIAATPSHTLRLVTLFSITIGYNALRLGFIIPTSVLSVFSVVNLFSLPNSVSSASRR
jgi:hypothetical protein